MKIIPRFAAAILLASLAFVLVAARALDQPVVIAASTLFDGKGKLLHDTCMVVQNGKILRVDPKAEPIAVRPCSAEGFSVVRGLAPI